LLRLLCIIIIIAWYCIYSHFSCFIISAFGANKRVQNVLNGSVKTSEAINT